MASAGVKYNLVLVWFVVFFAWFLGFFACERNRGGWPVASFVEGERD